MVGVGDGADRGSDAECLAQVFMFRESKADSPGVARAEFEEKQYEAAANIELRWGQHVPKVFPSGQVLEEILGYDTAAAPIRSHVIWRVLAVPRPKGLRLLPSLWPAGSQPSPDRLPRTPVSLVLQFKRPDHLRGPAATQWRLWHHSYFRFQRTERQHQVLRRLEERVGDAVVVRYAAPAFSSYGELEANQLAGTVLQNSGFVSPFALGSHKVWTYASPGATGYPNPDGDGLRFETVEELLFRDLRPAEQGDLAVYRPLPEHLQALAEAIGHRAPLLRAPVQEWMGSVARLVPELEPSQRLALHDYALVQSTLTRIGACWFLSGQDERPEKITL